MTTSGSHSCAASTASVHARLRQISEELTTVVDPLAREIDIQVGYLDDLRSGWGCGRMLDVVKPSLGAHGFCFKGCIVLRCVYRTSVRRWQWLALVVGALAVLASASAARNGHQTGRTEAIRAALSALRVHSRSGAEIVFALRSPVPAGTVVRDGGPARPASAGRGRHSSTRVVARTKGRASFSMRTWRRFGSTRMRVGWCSSMSPAGG